MGQIANLFKVSPAATMTSVFGPVDYVQERINTLLSIMPKGTVHVSTEQGIIGSGLYVPFIIIFENPLFEDGSTVELDMHRDVYLDKNTEKVVYLDVLTGIKYYKPDGTEKYQSYLGDK